MLTVNSKQQNPAKYLSNVHKRDVCYVTGVGNVTIGGALNYQSFNSEDNTEVTTRNVVYLDDVAYSLYDDEEKWYHLINSTMYFYPNAEFNTPLNSTLPCNPVVDLMRGFTLLRIPSTPQEDKPEFTIGFKR